MTEVDPPAVGPSGSEERPRGSQPPEPRRDVRADGDPESPSSRSGASSTPSEISSSGGGDRAPDRFVAALRRFIAETFRGGDPAGLDPDTPLVTSGIVDSVGVLEVVDFLHTEFGVQVPPAEVTLEHFDSLARLSAFVDSLGGRSRGDVPGE